MRLSEEGCWERRRITKRPRELPPHRTLLCTGVVGDGSIRGVVDDVENMSEVGYRIDKWAE